jgi:hypothetical protein
MMVGASGQLWTEAALAVATGEDGGMFVLCVGSLVWAGDACKEATERERAKANDRKRLSAMMTLKAYPQAPVEGCFPKGIRLGRSVDIKKIKHTLPSLPSIFL